MNNKIILDRNSRKIKSLIGRTYVPKGTWWLSTLNICNQKSSDFSTSPYAAVRNWQSLLARIGHFEFPKFSNSRIRRILIKANPIFEFRNLGNKFVERKDKEISFFNLSSSYKSHQFGNSFVLLFIDVQK